MTRNNLREHLNWILATKASLPLQSGQFDIPVLGESSTVRALTTQHNEPRSITTGLKLASGSDATDSRGTPPFLRPTILPGKQERSVPGEMARLQSALKSSTKSRLLSHAPLSEVKTPGSEVPRDLGSSLRDQYHAAFDRPESCTCIVQKEVKSCLMLGQCLTPRYPKPRLRERNISLWTPK